MEYFRPEKRCYMQAVANPQEAVKALDKIIQQAIERQSPVGYFAALYKNVTVTVIEGIKQGFFEDGPRMERLDTIFANRYFAAFHNFYEGQLPTRSWLQAFEANRNASHIILQYLIAGMNAHINLDLGIATARVGPAEGLPAIRSDFNKINKVLGQMTPIIEERIIKMSPKVGKLVTHLPFKGQLIMGFSMTAARDHAWKLAEDLAPLSRVDQLQLIDRRDKETKLFGAALLWNNPLFEEIKDEESTDIAANIKLLAESTIDLTKLS